MSDALIMATEAMRNSSIRNYIAPGVTSWLVGGNGHGKVRMFTTDRDTREWITPHSHRFGFTCLVLRGTVNNILFTRTYRHDQGNAYVQGTLEAGAVGQYEFTPGEKPEFWGESESRYSAGDTYSMRAHEIHTIQFGRTSTVLFFEGPETSDTSHVLEPWSDNRRIPTFVTQPWMFDRSAPQHSPGQKP